MDPQLHALARGQHSVVLRPQLLAAGYDDHDIGRLRRRGELSVVRRGAYMATGIWNQLGSEQRHRAAVWAVVHQMTVPAVPSHVSAAVMLGLPTWGLDLSNVHVTRNDLHSSRREAGVVHHAAGLDDDEIVEIEGVVVTGLLRTVVDIARTATFESAVVLADEALRRLGQGREPLLTAFDAMRTWPGARAACRVVAFADGASESVGESRARVQFQRIGLPPPVLQAEILGPRGERFRADFLFEDERTVAEFDGRAKYVRYLKPGESPADAVWREKRREDVVRAMGFGFVRLGWVDLDRDAEVRQRFFASFEQSRLRRAG